MQHTHPGILPTGLYWGRSCTTLTYFDCLVQLHPVKRGNETQQGIVWFRDSFLVERYGMGGSYVLIGPRIDAPMPRDVIQSHKPIWDDKTCLEKADCVLRADKVDAAHWNVLLRRWVTSHPEREWAHCCAEKLCLWTKKLRAYRRALFREKTR